jgi:hypothetical protein
MVRGSVAVRNMAVFPWREYRLRTRSPGKRSATGERSAVITATAIIFLTNNIMIYEE